MKLKDKVVLITGSSQGIGEKTALEFAKKGANVVVTYNSNKEKAEKVFEECNKLNEAFLIQLDVRNENSIKECIEKVIDKFGAINILVNNAGVFTNKNLMIQSSKEIDLQIDINLKGLIKMTKAILPFMKEQNESMIINISSTAGKNTWEEISVYCATKFGVRGFTQALAKELPENIKVYSINPGLTATAMTNFQGISAKKVAKIIIKVAEGEIKPDSTKDIDIDKFV